MHTKILKDIRDTDAREYLDYIITTIKSLNKDLYEEIECDLYERVYGPHFTEWLVKEATECMENEDGTTGTHWDINQTDAVAKSNGIQFLHFNSYDFNYVMNMLYSDFYQIYGNDTSVYVRLAKAWLCDKDAPEGKAFKYYMAMKY